jgi:integrase
VQSFLADRSRLCCRNTLRGMRISLGRVLGWAVDCGWLQKNPCSGVKLPQGRSRIVRTILKPEDVLAISEKLKEPYATLVLFLSVTGLRIGEAVAVKWSDFEGDILHVSRRIYQGNIDTPKRRSSERSLPIPGALLCRMRALGNGEWIFRSKRGTPINPGNAMLLYIRPIVAELGLLIGGWHDFRHTLSTRLWKNGLSPKVRADILGHSSVQTTSEIYDHADREDFRSALGEIASELLRDVTKSASVN